MFGGRSRPGVEALKKFFWCYISLQKTAMTFFRVPSLLCAFASVATAAINSGGGRAVLIDSINHPKRPPCAFELIHFDYQS